MLDASALPGPIAFVLFIAGIPWAILMSCAPFFWYGAWYRSKQAHLELEKIRAAMERMATNNETGSTEIDAAQPGD